MAKSILEEAMEDAKLLKETAIQNAKNVLVEAISPKIKEFVESQLGESGMYEEPKEEETLDAAAVDDQEQEQEGLGLEMQGMSMQEEPKPESGDPMQGMDLASMLKLMNPGQDREVEQEAFPAQVEAKEDGEDEDGEEKEKLEEGEECEEGEEEDDKVEEATMKENEVVEITEQDVKSAIAEMLGEIKLSEAKVTKSFGDVKDPTPKSAGGKGEMGIADEKSGEHQWKDVMPPEAKDWTVKEGLYKKQLQVLKTENVQLKTENKEYKEACMFLKRNLQEVNLFNSKLLYTNKLMQNTDLNNKQRLAIIEAFDRAQSLREVELVYKSLSESLKIAGVLSEGKQVPKTLKGPKSSRFVAPSSTLLQESAKREAEEKNSFTDRLQQLAGLVE